MREDEPYRLALVLTFTSITPENAMKWNVLQPQRGRFAFAEAASLVDFARAAGMRVRGHPLVWGQQLPAWVGDLPREEVEEALTAHVTRIVREFRGRVESWDVINEPFEDDGRWTDNAFHKALGPRYVEVALRATKRADPAARVFVNEIAAERPGPKRAALLDRVSDLGLDVELTEMDVVLGDDGGGPAGQAEAWDAAARACARFERRTGLTAWGVTDRHSWPGADQEPLLFDDEGRAKPALRPVREALTR